MSSRPARPPSWGEGSLRSEAPLSPRGVRDRVAEASLVQTDDSQRSPVSPRSRLQLQRTNYFSGLLSFSSAASVGGEQPLCLVLGLKPAGGGGALTCVTWAPTPLAPSQGWEPTEGASGAGRRSHARRGTHTTTAPHVRKAAFPLTGWVKGHRIRQSGRAPRSSRG